MQSHRSCYNDEIEDIGHSVGNTGYSDYDHSYSNYHDLDYSQSYDDFLDDQDDYDMIDDLF